MGNKSQLLLLLPLLFFACSKKAIPVKPPEPVAVKPALTVEEIDFGYFHGKARMVLRDGQKEREVKANIRIRKDSVIWMSFNVIGIQGGKALINKDSITIVSTVDKEYFVFDYAELSKRFNFEINYSIIQSAMLGNLLKPIQVGDEVTEQNSMYVLRQKILTIDLLNLINMASKKVEKIELKETSSNNTLTIHYSNFQPVADKVFPYNGTIELVYKTAAGLLNTTIICEYSKAEVGDRELKFPFNIPKRYDRR